MAQLIIDTIAVKVYKKESSEIGDIHLFAIKRQDGDEYFIEYIFVNGVYTRSGFQYHDTEDSIDEYFNNLEINGILEETVEELLKFKAEKTGFSEG